MGHPTLVRDTVAVTRLLLCRILLMNDCRAPTRPSRYRKLRQSCNARRERTGSAERPGGDAL